MKLNVVNEVLKLYEGNEQVKRLVYDYDKFVNSEQGRFLKDFYITWEGIMARELLSARHTRLSPGEKDVAQRTMFELKQAIDFLISPMKSVESRRKSLALK